MAKTTETQSRLKDANENLSSMKENLVDTIANAKSASLKKSIVLLGSAAKAYGVFKLKGKKGLKQARTTIGNNPGKSLAISFATGALLTYLLKRK